MGITTPEFNPENFVKGEPIDNNTSNYLQYTPGTTLVYETHDAEGVLTQIRTVTVTNKTKIIDGVTCIIVTDVVKDAETGKLIEKTEDYFAQDKSGNVWYFGESAKNYDENGKFLNTDGSWLAGVNGAAPGIVMEATPKVGDKYYQENAPGVAQDYAQVTSLHGDAGQFHDLLVTLDLNPLDVSSTGKLTENEYKYYATGVGEVYSETYELDGNKYVLAETEQLVSINGSTQLVQAMASFGASPSGTATPLTTTSLDQQAPHNLLAPGHHA